MNVGEPLKQTALHALHRELGARMVPFAGYDMPLQYPRGVLQEHLHTRRAAGLFDVSHMGQVRLSGPDAARALETLVPVDVIGLGPGQQRYGVFTNESGGILDDLMIARLGEDLLLVVNAACKGDDTAHLQKHLDGNCRIDVLGHQALLALQGPGAAAVLGKLSPDVLAMPFMSVRTVSLDGIQATLSRSGYTGEDGYEISVDDSQAEALARRLLADPEVAPVGLSARDSLRLEAGLCLYGSDIDTGTTPVEAGLLWALSKVRRPGGERAGGYPGAAVVFDQIANGVSLKRVGVLAEGAPIRAGTPLLDESGRTVGRVTSGGFGPSAGVPVGMAYVEAGLSQPGTTLYSTARGKTAKAMVGRMPFVPHRYHRA